MYVMKNESECQKGASSTLSGSNSETARSKGCVDLRNWQQIGVGGAQRMCRDVVAKKRAEVRWLRVIESAVLKYRCWKFTCIKRRLKSRQAQWMTNPQQQTGNRIPVFIQSFTLGFCPLSPSCCLRVLRLTISKYSLIAVLVHLVMVPLLSLAIIILHVFIIQIRWW